MSGARQRLFPVVLSRKEVSFFLHPENRLETPRERRGAVPPEGAGTLLEAISGPPSLGGIHAVSPDLFLKGRIILVTIYADGLRPNEGIEPMGGESMKNAAFNEQ